MNTVFVTSAGPVIALVVGVGLGYFVARYRRRNRRVQP